MMSINGHLHDPLVSVIIPCYNQGRFLADAVGSVHKQTYANVEILIVDDGSTDNTQQVALSFSTVRYIAQANAGLSAARNAGIRNSKGSFLVFLDADDVLYANGIQQNVKQLQENPSWAFVSGAHDKVDEWLYPLEDEKPAPLVGENHYSALLCGNYIGMHAAVMYRPRVFDEFAFDITLEACEDYDLYLRITRKYPVGCHQEKVAAYRHHQNSMSSHYLKMLTAVLKVHARQKGLLKDNGERKAWRVGRTIWQRYYALLLFKQLFTSIEHDKGWPPFTALSILAKTMPVQCRHYAIKKIRYNSLEFLKRSLPDRCLKWLHRAGCYNKYTPPPGKIEAGDFNRLTPFSPDFGFDRGGAIDRFYIEGFLEQHRRRVCGRVLEIGDNAYTVRFGGPRVERSDILHIDHRNAKATFTGDITHVPQIPSDAFDCIIFTQTLHLIYDFTSALKTCYRILKPGGCLLLTVPGISHIDRGLWRDYWLWSFTDVSIRRIMAETFNGSSVKVTTYGNVYVAAAFLYGMGLPEFQKKFLFHHDASYQVIISAAAIKR
jgi:glycosyltransferase involved in cell wall biosynthesis/SAM-dependent methyltransferase